VPVGAEIPEIQALNGNNSLPKQALPKSALLFLFLSLPALRILGFPSPCFFLATRRLLPPFFRRPFAEVSPDCTIREIRRFEGSCGAPSAIVGPRAVPVLPGHREFHFPASFAVPHSPGPRTVPRFVRRSGGMLFRICAAFHRDVIRQFATSPPALDAGQFNHSKAWLAFA
jgi:hypothetical protein